MKRKNATGEGTVIGKGTVVQGSITSDATMLRIDGTVNGDVDTKGVITVGADGTVNGNVTADSLILAGAVYGNVKVNEKVEIHTKGKLIGDVETKGITIDDEAVFKGNCKMDVAQEILDAVPEKTEEPKTEEAAAPEEKTQQPAAATNNNSNSNNNNNNNNNKKKNKR